MIVPMRESYWELLGGVLTQVTAKDTFEVHQLPSELRGIPHQSWTLKIDRPRNEDFGIDPDQDLLVIAESKVPQL